MSEIAEREYTTSVKSVAEEIIGEPVSSDEKMQSAFMRNTYVKEYLLSFRTIMKAGYEVGRDDVSFSHKVISELEKNVAKNAGTEHSTQSVPWMVALSILTNDESIQGVSDTRLRFIFDLAIGIAADDYRNRFIETKRTAAYTEDPKQKEELCEYSVQWKKISDEWEKYQDELQEQVSSTDGPERR
jgi:hypothetical protein